MRKIFIAIAVLSALGIALFFYFLPQNRERNDIYYRSIVTYENIEYKSVGGVALTLDLIIPENSEYDSYPLIIYVHGGYFTDGDKSDLTLDNKRETVNLLLANGYAIASVEYRLLDVDTHFPSSIIDVKDSIRFLYSVAETYNLDTNNFGLWGNSAGAYLALTAAYSADGLYLGEYTLREYSSSVNYVVDFYGPSELGSVYDVNEMTTLELADKQKLLDYLYGKDQYDIYNLTDNDYEAMKIYDPLSYVSVDTIPTLIIHGTLDETVDISQSDLLEAKLIEYDIEYEYHKILSGNHGLTNIDESEQIQINNYFLDFLDEFYVSE